MIPKEITAEHVVAAIAEIRAAGSPSTRSSRGYSIVYEGEHFPPKYVVSLAAKYAVGRELRPNQFNGGQETNSFLRGLGFDIAGTSAPDISPGRPKRTGKKPVTTHNERCQECKNVVTAMLKVLYGAVETNKRFQIGALPEAFEKSAYSNRLDVIYEALQSSRGFKDFVRASSLPACDYFVPEPGFVLEFDESQHFTEHRQLALSQYPSELPMSFDAAKWRHLCQQIGARDYEPPFRDEQRAWYDTLRDFLPTVFSLKPTSRLYASEYPWCTLQPNSAEDVTKFRQILSERTYVWTINMGAVGGQRFVRLVMDGAWGGDLNAARRLLGDVAAAWPSAFRSVCLCTCGAFLRFDWPNDLSYKGNRDPGPQERQILIAAAQKAVWSVLTPEIVDRLRACCDYITLGADTKKDKISTTYNIISQPHAELVCLVNLRKCTIHWTGKFYPTSGQASTIVRFPDLQSHFAEFDRTKVMILGCHDLSVYSPRGQATAGDWRRNIGEQFRSMARQAKPIAVLHHPHTTVKVGTWRQQWKFLGDDLPFIEHYLGTGVYSHRDDGWSNRDNLSSVIDATERGDVSSIIVRLASQQK